MGRWWNYLKLEEVKMAVYLYALTSSGGVPLYSRTLGDGKPVSFPILTLAKAYNVVFMFACQF